MKRTALVACIAALGLQFRPVLAAPQSTDVAENARVTVTHEADPGGHVTRLLLRSPDGEARATRVEGR
jgi:hypothetical protein